MIPEFYSGAPAWAVQMATLLLSEIDDGRLVQVALPGAAVPVLVDDATVAGDMLVLRDAKGRSYHAAHPAGLVVICEPRPELPNPAAGVDEWRKRIGEQG
jgi:hypothetical protein